jgi:uncharacterized protein (TIGR00661 family)
MCGEGRGHAARVRSVVEQLKGEHQLVLFAPDQAFEFLAPRYPAGTPNVEVRRIPGLRFHYTRNRLDLTKSILTGLGFLWKMPYVVRRLKRTLRAEQPDLVIADFEPTLPRAARAVGIPFLSLNHQHFLVACDLTKLPPSLQTWANMMSLAVRAHHRGQRRTIISSFFHTPLKSGFENAVQVGPLLRPEVLATKPRAGEHLVSYFRTATPPHVLEMLKQTKREVRVYGLGERPNDGCLKFCPLNEHTFVEDVATSAALIGAAGNQTLGEAVYLGKPVFALPEESHHEQLINAHFLAEMGAGDFQTLEAVQPSHLTRFLHRLDEFRDRLQTFIGRIDGTPAALAEIKQFLPAKMALR